MMICAYLRMKLSSLKMNNDLVFDRPMPGSCSRVARRAAPVSDESAPIPPPWPGPMLPMSSAISLSAVDWRCSLQWQQPNVEFRVRTCLSRRSNARQLACRRSRVQYMLHRSLLRTTHVRRVGQRDTHVNLGFLSRQKQFSTIVEYAFLLPRRWWNIRSHIKLTKWTERIPRRTCVHLYIYTQRIAVFGRNGAELLQRNIHWKKNIETSGNVGKEVMTSSNHILEMLRTCVRREHFWRLADCLIILLAWPWHVKFKLLLLY